MDSVTQSRRESLMRAAMKGVRLYGIDGVRVRQIADIDGGVASNINMIFGTKEALLLACFDWVDRQIARIFDNITVDPAQLAADPEGEIRRLWTPYWRWLVAHPDETVFYHRFRDSPVFPIYDKKRDVSYFASFLKTLGLFAAQFHLTDLLTSDVIWLHVLTCTVLYGKYVAQGVLPNTAATEEAVFQMEMNGLRGLLTRQGEGDGPPPGPP